MNVMGILVLGFVAILIASAILQWLWNITIPQVFGLKAIEYWEALRLLLIAGLLFGGGRINLNFGRWSGRPSPLALSWFRSLGMSW